MIAAEEIGREAIKQSEGVLTEAYKDLGRPILKPIGEILGFLPRTLKLTLSGWEKWLINGEESLQLTAEAIQEKVKKIPEEKLVEPEPYVAIPAIQQISYCQNSDELRELYANLLVASMNADTKWNVHPSYVDIIKQLSPDEAKYLRHLPNLIYSLHPLIDVNFFIGDGDESNGTNPIISNFTNYNIDKLEHPQQICSYIDNLARLNLIEIPPEQYLTNTNVYKALEKHPYVQNPLRVTTGVKVNYRYKHKFFRLTNIGVDFKNVVCS